MPTQVPSAAQCGDLAQQFHDLASLIGNYRLNQYGTLTVAQQYQLQNQQMQCLQYSSSFITQGLSLEQTTLTATLKAIKNATTQARNAIAANGTVDKTLQIITSLAVLGASIYSMNPSAIQSGIQGVISTLQSDAGSPAGAGGI
ncbi:hypothetical protein [Acidipila sp. EB88]|uniref:hypothetical protein n=1 Tax=Acidipila sp. EB88 TaxID=2305226 RepID=UPI000F5E17CD|nr:hypothetical protein [Acidipila sp. EB88]RRA50479.1 hypothetical protein D1Y84_00245 [Acidipila sp. EB88]